MKETLFYGYYGHQNTGDDAFIEVTAWGAKKYWHSSKNKFLTQNLPQVQNKVEHSGKSYFKGHHLLKHAASIILGDAFICAGGSTFHSQLSRMNPKNIARTKKNYFPNFKLGAIGVSLGPYKSTVAEKENIELLKHFDFLALRDQASYQIAKTYDLPYEPIEAFDLAALLPEVYSGLPKHKVSNHEKIIGISICNYESYLRNGDLDNEERRNKQIEDFVVKLARAKENFIFRLFIFNGNLRVGDQKITMSLANKLRAINPKNVEIIEYDPCTYHSWLRIKECNLVISTRLHAAIFACFANVPFFLVEYHRKCADFLDDVGYDLDSRIYDADFSPEEFADKIYRQLMNERVYLNPSNLDLVKEKSRYNFTKVNIHGR